MGETGEQPLVIDDVRLHPLRIPLGRTVRWASLLETSADYLILELRAQGLRGVAEGAVKITFAAATLKTLACAFDEIFIPRLLGLNAADDGALSAVFAGLREHGLAKAMIDAAVWDIRAQAAGKPLWRLLGGKSGQVPLSYTITRNDPAVMARAAEEAVANWGFSTLKIKTGQGREQDRTVLRAIRAAVGPDTAMYADSNGAYAPGEVASLTAMFAEEGLLCAEDPCVLVPDASFASVKDACRLPLLVDGPCRSLGMGKLFLAAGAEALSLKIGKTGIGDSLKIRDAAGAHDPPALVHVGMLAEGSLGALTAASLAAALPGGWLPCEASYFLQLPACVLTERPSVVDGILQLPESGGFADLVDWSGLSRLTP